jgi:hypothetical protein
MTLRLSGSFGLAAKKKTYCQRHGRRRRNVTTS